MKREEARENNVKSTLNGCNYFRSKISNLNERIEKNSTKKYFSFMNYT